MRQRAFTLIELLVVIAVIALLISLILPAMAASRRTARLTACLANVRTQGTMVSAYTNEFKDALPPRVQWLTRPDPDFGAVSEINLINAFLSRWEGHPWEKPDVGWPTPTGAWRCPDVKPDADEDRWTHSGILHFAPNTWVYNSVNENDDAHTLRVWADALTGFEGRAAIKSWHRSFIVEFPREVVSLMDDVSYFNASHGHREAHESDGLSGDVVQECKAFKNQQSGSHDAMKRRPAVFFDNHAEALPSTPEYWLNARDPYAAPGGGTVQLYAREVQRFLWFVKDSDKSSGGS